ncbi:ABC transporter permease [Corynebacterium camporealensis]
MTSLLTPNSSSTQPSIADAFRRTRALARAEWLQFLRNPTLLFMAFTMPGATAGITYYMYASVGSDALTRTDIASMSTEVFFLVGFIFVQYYSVLSMVTARRDEGVLKRLRSGEASDRSTLAAICVPGALILAVSAVLVLIVFGILGDEAPENLWALAIGLCFGIAISAAAALVTSIYTKTVESAQVTSMPVVVIGMFSQSGLLASMPDNLQRIFELNPFALICELVQVGWGVAEDPGILRVLGLIVLWLIVLSWWGVKKLRWDSHRG